MSALTERQREVLTHLAARDREWTTTNGVNRLVGRPGVSARGILGRLELGGLVERKTSPLTGRHHWRITDRGRAA